MKSLLGDLINECFDTGVDILSVRPVSGGDINMAYACRTDHGDFFIKLNQPSRCDMADAERMALQELDLKSGFKVPTVYGVVSNQQYSALILEHINLSALSGAGYYLAGEKLAQMHRCHQPYFGWIRDNYIGTTLQPNTRSGSWLAFLLNDRLKFQIELLNNRNLNELAMALPRCLTILFKGYESAPSLIHGDLWSGNIAADTTGQPVVFDPACYYGDREMDLAMTELFGGFPQSFYQGYNAVWPLDTGYEQRKPVYQLYHILNHANLFGGDYVDRAERMLRRILEFSS
ncbi:MAG: fructosamine kinase family protein [Reinekea sp.]